MLLIQLTQSEGQDGAQSDRRDDPNVKRRELTEIKLWVLLLTGCHKFLTLSEKE